MGDLAVTVLVHGNVVDDRVVSVRRMVRLGESDDAAVAFPGADLAIVRVGRGLALRGRVLEEGEEMCISLGHVEVRLLHTVRGGAFPLEWGTFLDKRFLAAAIVATVSGTWLDTAESWVERHGPALDSTVVDTFLATMEGRGAVEAKAVVAPDAHASEGTRPTDESRTTQGPRHESDDRLTGTGYYAWYRAAVMADAAHESWGPLDRTDIAARRRLARRPTSDDPGCCRVATAETVEHGLHPTASPRVGRAPAWMARLEVALRSSRRIPTMRSPNRSLAPRGSVAWARLGDGRRRR